MIWLDYFLQLLCNAVAWTLAIVIGLLVLVAAAKTYGAVSGWLWRRSTARGIRRRIASL